MGEVDILDGRMTSAMPSDPDALRAGTRSVLLTTMAAWTFVPTCHAAYLLGVWAGTILAL